MALCYIPIVNHQPTILNFGVEMRKINNVSKRCINCKNKKTKQLKKEYNEKDLKEFSDKMFDKYDKVFKALS